MQDGDVGNFLFNGFIRVKFAEQKSLIVERYVTLSSVLKYNLLKKDIKH
jgi:hypothetical protein